ncbi:glycosyltransferase family 15 protein [Rhizodiscina lignyota]|uniref:Glycosyltransferase family 15 protein n=1 Tax=Rhizodiscina lignyota TaxID=1504668 RepID=A0A9P4M5Z1_9PEZI|nr:glycosyltransferase family 15 protein [Rhizodiscina lignyota]
MAISKSIRFLGVATVVLCIWLVLQVFRTDGGGKLGKIQKMDKDPLLDITGEPEEPLQRVDGDNYAPDNPKSARRNATLLSLVRNSELEDMLMSMRDLERTFNSKFNYPWLFLNDKPFTQDFMDAIRKETKAEVRFEQVPKEHWEVPPWINNDLYLESVQLLLSQNVQYMSKVSYHQMCRWNSGFFYKHPALLNTRYYWRVEPHVHFFCDIDYDVFAWMEDHNKTYGFTVNIYDSPESVQGLWPETQKFMAEHKEWLAPNNAIKWLQDNEVRPDNHRVANGYSTCHFWSNFEIGDMDFWRGPAYEAYFNHLDRAGGFFYERWGDAPVHSIGLGLFEDASKIHWFRDIGYQHIPFFNCPNSPKCKGCQPGRFTDGEQWLHREDCRPNWFKYVGQG